MNTVTVRILQFIVAAFVLITVFSQVSLLLKDDYKTETAVSYSSAQVIPFKGVCVRDETVITYNGSGVVSYPYPDGSKIAKDSVVAYVYNNQDAINVNQHIDSLDSEIKLLENAQSPGTTEVAQQEFIADLISEKYQQITSLNAKNDYEGVMDERNNFLSLLSIYRIVVNDESNYNDRIAELQSDEDLYKSKQVKPKDSITIKDSGYFVSYTDGFENVINLENIDVVSDDVIRHIVSDDNKSIEHGNTKKVGKMISGYKWKMVGFVSKEFSDLQPGNTVSLRFSSTSDKIEAVVDSVEPTEDGQEYKIIISCDKLTYNFVQNRVENIELILNDCEGIKIPRTAIRFNQDNEKGVYILLGQRVAFRKIDTIYENDEYILSRITTDKSYVGMYDDIIVGGISTQNLLMATETETESESEEETDESLQQDIDAEEIIDTDNLTNIQQTEESSSLSTLTEAGDDIYE